VSLGDVENIGALENQDKAYSDKGINHAQGKTAYHQL
jgi:hypothetical protein